MKKDNADRGPRPYHQEMGQDRVMLKKGNADRRTKSYHYEMGQGGVTAELVLLKKGMLTWEQRLTTRRWVRVA